MSKQTENKGGSKVATFLKKNIYYILMVVAVLAIVAMIVVAAVAGQQDTPIDGPNHDDPVINKPDDNKPTVDDKPEFKFVIALPIETETIGLDYSEDELVFHPTQGAWKTQYSGCRCFKSCEKFKRSYNRLQPCIQNAGA